MQYFFDTSALVKIYHQEIGSDRILPLYQGNEVIVISELSKVEFVSTIHKKLRMGEITADTLDAVKNRFLADCSGRFVVIHVASFIVDAALDLMNTHGGPIISSLSTHSRLRHFPLFQKKTLPLFARTNGSPLW
jgi:uncharacterized protein with PIN domain